MARRGDPAPVCASSRKGPGSGARLCPEARSSERDGERTCKGLETPPKQKSLQKSLQHPQPRVHWPLPSQRATCQPRQCLHESTWYTQQRENVCHIPLHLSQNPIDNQHSVTRSPLLKFIPIPRSGSSKSIHSSVSSQPASSRPSSPFSSPRTPLSPLPFFLTSRKRRASAVPGPGDDSVPQCSSEGSQGIGVPLARVARRPSPVRTATPPIPEDIQTQTAKPRSRTSQYPDPSIRTRRPSEAADEAAPHTPHLLFDGGVPLTRVERRRPFPRSQTIGT